MQQTKRTVLVIEDESGIRNFICTVLSTNGYQAVVAENGTQAQSLFFSHAPEVVLLDLGLPDIDGISLLKEIRKWSAVPVIVVSARNREADKVEALDLGADDYITKPFGSSELLARIRAALRHAKVDGQAAVTEVVETGELRIDLPKRQIFLRGQEVHLTQIEYKIVALLAKHVGKVLTYDYIIQHIWGPYITGDNQILRVNMANIRRKLEENPAEPRYIRTELGVGYRMLE